MIKIKSILWMMVTAVAGGFAIVSCSSSDSSPVPIPPRDNTPVDYTIMFYSAGGENLDCETENDLLKAAKALQASDKQVRFIVQYKYSTQAGLDKQKEEQNYVPCGVAGGLYRFELLPSHINANGVLEYFNENMLYGSQQQNSQIYRSDSITSFINYCQRVAPAKNYILLFSDHGSGYAVWADYPKTRAIVSDKFHDDKSISICDIRDGIKNSNMRHVKMINFDACLMNNIEVITEVMNETDYVMASSHISNGGNYTELVNSLRGADNDAIFEKNMSSYLNSTIQNMYNSMTEGDNNAKFVPENTPKRCDWLLTNTAKFRATVPTAVKAFTDKFISEYNADHFAPDDLQKAANNCYQPAVGYSLYDIGQYVHWLAKANGNLNDVAAALKAAMENAQVCHYYTNKVLEDLSSMEYQKLSYTVNLGAKVGGLVLLRADIPNSAGKISCNESNGYYYYYTPGESTCELDTEEPRDANRAWDNSYRTTAFDKTTGWSKWLETNTHFPTKNPPFMCP